VHAPPDSHLLVVVQLASASQAASQRNRQLQIPMTVRADIGRLGMDLRHCHRCCLAEMAGVAVEAVVVVHSDPQVADHETAEIQETVASAVPNFEATLESHHIY
jgi:hypothetical protein